MQQALQAANPVTSLTTGSTGHIMGGHVTGPADDVVPGLAGDATGTAASSSVMGLRGLFRNLAIATAVPLNTTGDHATFTITPVLAPYVLKELDAANCTAQPGLAQISIWTGPNATGTRLIAPTLMSSIAGLTGLGALVTGSAINSPRQSVLTLYLHVDIANLTAASCAFYLQGIASLDAAQLATSVAGY